MNEHRLQALPPNRTCAACDRKFFASDPWKTQCVECWRDDKDAQREYGKAEEEWQRRLRRAREMYPDA
jgi:hypothetical protein